MADFTKGEVIAEGKTKTIFAVKEFSDLAIVESKDDITKNDDPSQTKIMESKAKYSTRTTSAVFALLKDSGIPVAWRRQLSETEFLAEKCQMLPLEVIIRRYAVGSYLERHPELKNSGASPHRFHRLEFELFLKTTGGAVTALNGEKFDLFPGEYQSYGISPELEVMISKNIEDPLIENPFYDVWRLMHPKLPRWDENSFLVDFRKGGFLPDNFSINEISEIARKTFLVLESAWSQLGMRLVDFKIELGINSEEKVVVSDVIDNDSWRLRTTQWEELSKQLFRDNRSMEEIANKYALVSGLVSQFRIPKQALVIWKGSDSDKISGIEKIPGINVVDFAKSGHRAPLKCLDILENILAGFPDGGVIVIPVGMSDGLGPMLAARTSWPAIALPTTVKERPHDVWSSLEAPKEVPLLTVLYEKNAILAALNILAQKNPVAYMYRQLAIEELDK